MSNLTHNKAGVPGDAPEVDVCLIVEGCYPYVSGGVSAWIDWMLRTQPELSFCAVALVADGAQRVAKYPKRDNLHSVVDLQLKRPTPTPPVGISRRLAGTDAAIADALIALLRGGGVAEFAKINAIVNRPGASVPFGHLVSSQLAWNIACRMYDQVMPHASFLHFYWAWQALTGGMFAVLKFPLPRARAYHTISTGYAGLLAARATIETGRPSIITEHGIYTNERRIEILMADWIADTVNKGVGLTDDRIDLRDLWIKTFDAYALTCYQAMGTITTLYRENQSMQINLGAPRERLRVIANGIEVEQFEKLPLAGTDVRATMALIGRVVPIKDIKTFIMAAGQARAQVPDLRAIVMGPFEEDRAYYEECVALVAELELEQCIEFTGPVKITEYLPKVHVVVLTSLSEAQPLVLLEAGAAGIPCVTTDVGSCREILEGAAEESPHLGQGGYVTHLVAPDEIGAQVAKLLNDEPLRRQLGENLRTRVRTYYASAMARDAYSALYRQHCEQPTAPLARQVR
jgi:polysaccharide biosynthesis protein PelF